MNFCRKFLNLLSNTIYIPFESSFQDQLNENNFERTNLNERNFFNHEWSRTEIKENVRAKGHERKERHSFCILLKEQTSIIIKKSIKDGVDKECGLDHFFILQLL